MFEDLIPELQGPASALVEAAGSAGLLPRVTSTRRSPSQQARLYRRYLAGQAGFPVAPPGTSAHEFGWAFDMVTSPMEALADVGYTWQTWGGVWGPGDAVHFEYPGFSPPMAEDQRNVVQKAASWFDSLPWYIQMVLPMSTFTGKPMEAEELQRSNPKLFAYIKNLLGL